MTNHTKLMFCSLFGVHTIAGLDMSTLTSDLPTLLGVSTGIAVLGGLICMVLHLFSKTKYPRHRQFTDNNLPPPIMYSSDTGIHFSCIRMQPTYVHISSTNFFFLFFFYSVHSARPSSRSSIRSNNSFGSYGQRRFSSAPHTNSMSGSKGVLVSTSRSGAEPFTKRKLYRPL